MSCDPLANTDGPNIYQFALSNPVRFTDRLGTQNAETTESLADQQLAWKQLQLKMLYGQHALDAGMPLSTLPQSYVPNAQPTESQKKVAPGAVAPKYVSDLDRQIAHEEQIAATQRRAAALAAAVGVTIIAPQVIALLSLEGTAAAAIVSASAEASSDLAVTYAMKGTVDAEDVVFAVGGGTLSGLSAMPAKSRTGQPHIGGRAKDPAADLDATEEAVEKANLTAVNDVGDQGARSLEVCVPSAAAVIDRRFATPGEKTATVTSIERAAGGVVIGTGPGQHPLETVAMANELIHSATGRTLTQSPFFSDTAKEGMYVLYVPLAPGNKPNHAIIGWVFRQKDPVTRQLGPLRRFVFDPSGVNWSGLGSKARDVTRQGHFPYVTTMDNYLVR